MRRMHPRGPLGRALDDTLTPAPGCAGDLIDRARAAVATSEDVLEDDDVQATLTTMYELHYSGLDDVDDGWEWDAGLLSVRAVLETAFEERLRELVPPESADVHNLPRRLFEIIADDDGPSLSRFLERKADLGQWREFLTHRSVYQLKEADPHAFGIPRLPARAKVALAEIEADEFGGGMPDRMHAALFAKTLRAVGLDDTLGAYLDTAPACTLAHLNVMSLLALHRRWRGALVGHLAAFEMTSSIPNRRYGNGLRRLRFDVDATDYFDEHVEADAVHEQIAAHDLAGGLVADEPELAGDVVFGVRVALALDARLSGHILRCWDAGQSSLRGANAELAATG
jgi:Iron-containing redox enzyme